MWYRKLVDCELLHIFSMSRWVIPHVSQFVGRTFRLLVCQIFMKAVANLGWFFIGLKSDHCLAFSLSPLVEFCSTCWICQICCIDFSMFLLNGFIKIETWISLSCYMDLSKFGFLKYFDCGYPWKSESICLLVVVCTCLFVKHF